MKPECEQAIQAAAGRNLTKAELDGIEQRIQGSIRELAVKDHGKFLAMTPHERVTEAAKMAKERMMADVVRAHEQSINEASTKAALHSTLDAVKPGVKGQVHALKNMVAGLETKVDALSANFFRMVGGLNEADSGKLFGMIQDPAKQRDIAGAMFGEHSTPEAKRAADSLMKMTDALADRYQRAGLTLNKRENYRMPQPQDPTRMGSKDTWVEDHLNWVDRKEYVRPDGKLMTDDEMRHMLRESHQTIMTDGANKRAKDEARGGSALVGNARNAPRQLFFKDADAWTQAMQKYGRTTNMYELIASHVRTMAKDIAMAEQFGRKADDNFTQALARAHEKDLMATSGKDQDAARAMADRTQRMYDAYAHPERPGNEAWANAGVQIRGLMASSQLGSLFGALPDLAGMKLAAEHSGLPFVRTFKDFVEGTFAGKEKQEFLHRLGVWQEGFQHATHRMAEDGLKSGWGTFLNELTHRAMGLNAFDRGMRSGMGRSAMDVLGKFTRSHDTLASAEGEARLLQEHGINEDHWNVWKQAELNAGPNGKEHLLTPDAIYKIPDAKLDPIVEQRVAARSEIFKAEIEKRDAQLARLKDKGGDNAKRIAEIRDAFQAKHDALLSEERANAKDEAAEKLLEVAYGEMQFGARGASRSSLEDRIAMGVASQANAGTIAGELWRFALQFKSVPIGIFRAHWQRMQSYDTWGSKSAYAAKFMGYSMLMGALATEIKAMISGQDPRNMNIDTEHGRKFWLEAMAAGGGLGLYGDLFLNGETAARGGVETIAGPGIAALWDVRKQMLAAKDDAVNGESKHPYALGALQWVRKNATPMANLWYAKAAFNRLVYDNLAENLAPGSTYKQAQRMQSRGAAYWWQPGHNTPDRAPDLNHALESQ